jgi:transcriptional regulator with PAS, ATPase and Fis domain
MLEVFRLCERAIDSDITVLIEGETGTGKELIARIIHFNGPRTKMPFVSQNCGGIPDTLLASELFGHKRGSFTGAVKDKKGLFETAHGGTVFLDEVAEMSPAMQTSLLWRKCHLLCKPVFCEFYRKARSRPWDQISARKWMSG